MKFFLDTANLDELKKGASWGIVDGASTDSTPIGSLMSERGELFSKQKELETREQQLTEDLERRGLSVGRIAAMMSSAIPDGRLSDAAAEVRKQLSTSRFAASRIAIGVGSRGIHNIATIVRDVRQFWNDQGMHPFTFRPIGSHEAVSAAGQAAVLAHYTFSEVDIEALELFSKALELLRVQTELDRIGHSIQLSTHEIARALQRYRAQSRALTVVLQQRPFFILHSFHPPHANSFLQNPTFGRIGLVA